MVYKLDDFKHFRAPETSALKFTTRHQPRLLRSPLKDMSQEQYNELFKRENPETFQVLTSFNCDVVVAGDLAGRAFAHVANYGLPSVFHVIGVQGEALWRRAEAIYRALVDSVRAHHPAATIRRVTRRGAVEIDVTYNEAAAGPLSAEYTILLREFATIDAVFAAQDIPAAAVAFNGFDTFLSERAAVAHALSVNVVDPAARLSARYESRLAQYVRPGGFAIGLDRARVEGRVAAAPRVELGLMTLYISHTTRQGAIVCDIELPGNEGKYPAQAVHRWSLAKQLWHTKDYSDRFGGEAVALELHHNIAQLADGADDFWLYDEIGAHVCAECVGHHHIWTSAARVGGELRCFACGTMRGSPPVPQAGTLAWDVLGPSACARFVPLVSANAPADFAHELGFTSTDAANTLALVKTLARPVPSWIVRDAEKSTPHAMTAAQWYGE